MIDMIPELVDIPVPTGFAGAKNSTNNMPHLVRQMTSEEVVADSKFRDAVVGGPTSTPLKIAGLIVYLAGDITVGLLSPADLAGDVTVGVSFPANLAGDVTIHLSSLADLAGDVTVSVASPADLADLLFDHFLRTSRDRPCRYRCHCRGLP